MYSTGFVSFEIVTFMLFQSNFSRAIETYTFRFIGGASNNMAVFSIQGEKRMQEVEFD